MAERVESSVYSQTVTVDEVDDRKSDVFEDPHVKDCGMVKELKTSKGNPVKIVGPAVKFSELENKVRSAPPSLGEHSCQILREVLNYSDSKITELLRNGDVK